MRRIYSMLTLQGLKKQEHAVVEHTSMIRYVYCGYCDYRSIFLRSSQRRTTRTLAPIAGNSLSLYAYG